MAQINMKKNHRLLQHGIASAILLSAFLCLMFADPVHSAIYGIKDPQGNFQPKVTVSLGKKEVVISKIDPEEKFKSFALVLNSKNANLLKNLSQISVEWLNAENKGGKPSPFISPSWDSSKLRFEEPMTRSVTLKLTDKSGKNLLAAKSVSELFTIQIDNNALSQSQTGPEADSPIKFGSGRDVSLNLDKTHVQFDESNIKKGEIINLDNRSGLDQLVGIELPEKSLLYYQIVRKPEQTKVPRENWGKFTIGSDSGIFIVLIPESDPAHLAALDGKEVSIRVYQGDKVRETLKVPIRTSGDATLASADSGSSGIQVRDITSTKSSTKTDKQASREPERTPVQTESRTSTVASPQNASSFWNSTLPWLLIVLSITASLGIMGYGVFFLLPKIQVLEDRLAKSEMFIHGSREAIREELDLIKDEVSRHSDRPPRE